MCVWGSRTLNAHDDDDDDEFLQPYKQICHPSGRPGSTGHWACVLCVVVKTKFFHVHTALIEALMEPAKYPGCSGTRNLHDNLSDLRAQVAANQKVITSSSS